MNNKKLIIILMALMLLFTLMTGCAQEANEPEGSSQEEATETEGSEEAEESEESEEQEAIEFSMTINGTEFTQDDAKDLEMVTKEVLKVSKKGESNETWSGYQVDELLQAAGVSDYSTVVVAAEDGFSGEITAEEAKLETTLFGMLEEGEETSADDIPTLVVDGGGGNVWIKGIVEVTAE